MFFRFCFFFLTDQSANVRRWIDARTQINTHAPELPRKRFFSVPMFCPRALQRDTGDDGTDATWLYCNEELVVDDATVSQGRRRTVTHPQKLGVGNDVWS